MCEPYGAIIIVSFEDDSFSCLFFLYDQGSEGGYGQRAKPCWAKPQGLRPAQHVLMFQCKERCTCRVRKSSFTDPGFTDPAQGRPRHKNMKI